MPIIVKDFSWSQTTNDVKVNVKIKSAKPGKVDIFTSGNYLKVHSPPYLWECFLSEEIIDSSSKCQIFDGIVQFTLKKREDFDWMLLEKEIDAETKNTIRNAAIAEAHNETAQQRKETAKYREEKKREEIMKATSRDAKSRDDYTNLLKNLAHHEVLEPIPKPSNETVQAKPSNVEFLKPKPVKTPIDTPRPKPKPLPAIRKNGNISISFSDRNFVTPKRESQEVEEREWLIKQKEARKAIGFVEEDLRPEERNPQWLKEKADQFFEQKNYLGAISAYSTAIRLTDKYHELFLNRAAAHFQAENYLKCAEDCSRAYELLVPVCAANLQPRKDCLARRGAALVRLGLIKQGYDEVVAALKLDPTDKVLERDAEMLRCKLERST